MTTVDEANRFQITRARLPHRKLPARSHSAKIERVRRAGGREAARRRFVKRVSGIFARDVVCASTCNSWPRAVSTA